MKKRTKLTSACAALLMSLSLGAAATVPTHAIAHATDADAQPLTKTKQADNKATNNSSSSSAQSSSESSSSSDDSSSVSDSSSSSESSSSSSESSMSSSSSSTNTDAQQQSQIANQSSSSSQLPKTGFGSMKSALPIVGIFAGVIAVLGAVAIIF